MSVRDRRLIFRHCFAVTVAVAAGLVTVAHGAPAGTQSDSLIDRFLGGEWSVQPKGGARTGFGAPICVRSVEGLVQPEHRGLHCAQTVVERTNRVITVHYRCAAAGWGQTTVRMINPSLAQIETQGMAGMNPFDYVAVASRSGACSNDADDRPGTANRRPQPSRPSTMGFRSPSN